jgi:hypothetical protein
MVLWGVFEWGSNFFRGVSYALQAERGAGKEAIAAAAEQILGAGFPYHSTFVLLTMLVPLCGVGLIALLSRDARRHAPVDARLPK